MKTLPVFNYQTTYKNVIRTSEKTPDSKTIKNYFAYLEKGNKNRKSFALNKMKKFKFVLIKLNELVFFIVNALVCD